MSTESQVECSFCRTAMPREETWESKKAKGTHWCNDEMACNKRWLARIREGQK